MTAPVQLISEALIADLLQKAAASPRRRINHNFHPSLADNPHRFLNVMLRGSYFSPHRHRQPPKAETFLVMRGKLALFLFGDEGGIHACHVLGPGEGNLGIDLAPGQWHTLAVLSEHCVCFEVKPGPYEASSDKEFAGWAPREGEPGCEEYLSRLVAHAQRTG